MSKKGTSHVSIDFFCLTVLKNFVGGTPLGFSEFLVLNIFIDKKGRKVGVSQFSIENFLSHCTENFVGEPLCVSGKFWYRKILWARGVYYEFLSKFFSLTVTTNFVGDPFCVSEFSWYRKGLWIRGVYHEFLSKIFFLTVPNNFVGQPLCVSKNSGIERFYGQEGYITFFCRKFFVSQ